MSAHSIHFFLFIHQLGHLLCFFNVSLKKKCVFSDVYLGAVRMDRTAWIAERNVTALTPMAVIQLPVSAAVLQVGRVSYGAAV